MLTPYQIALRERKLGIREPEEKKPKPIAKMSAKRKVENKALAAIVKELMTICPDCQIKSPVCTGKAQGSDHTQKRSPKNLLNKKNIKLACNPCNLYKEEHPEWAKKNGHSISRFVKI
jgi:hypothetical protein